MVVNYAYNSPWRIMNWSERNHPNNMINNRAGIPQRIVATVNTSNESLSAEVSDEFV
jgi:hypothetical protein